MRSRCTATPRASAAPLGSPAVPRREVIDELWSAVRENRAPLHDGVWARATLEICRAILESARTGVDVVLQRQVEPESAHAPSRHPPRDAEIAQRLLKHWHEAVPNDRMAHLVKDASRSFLRALQSRLNRYDGAAGPLDVPAHSLGARRTRPQRELSNEAGVMEPTTVIALRAMEQLGYIRRQRLDGNRKNLYVFLTPAGKRLKRQLVPLAEEVNAVALRGIAPADAATTRRCLLAMLDNLAPTAWRPRRRRREPAGLGLFALWRQGEQALDAVGLVGRRVEQLVDRP